MHQLDDTQTIYASTRQITTQASQPNFFMSDAVPVVQSAASKAWKTKLLSEEH